MSREGCLLLNRSSTAGLSMKEHAGRVIVHRQEKNGLPHETFRDETIHAPERGSFSTPNVTTATGVENGESSLPLVFHSSVSSGLPAYGERLGSDNEMFDYDVSDSLGGSSDESEEECTKLLPLHDLLMTEEEMEVAETIKRNRRILLSRMEETIPTGRLAMINLSRRGLKPRHALLLSEAILRNPQLSVLKLSYNDFGDRGVATIAASLIQNGKHHEKLSILDLGFNSITDVGCEALSVSCVAGNFTLQSLYLSGNQIGEVGALSIAGAILHGTGLLALHLTLNNIGCTGLKALAGAIAKNEDRVNTAVDIEESPKTKPQTLQELHVGSTGLGPEGFIAIPGLLVSNFSLRSINLSDCCIGDQELALLSQVFTQNKRIPLENLDLSFNEITCQGIECLMNSIWGSQTLRSLKLDNNRLRDRGAQLCAVVLTSIPLDALDLSFNRMIGTNGIKSLMKNISENRSLQFLGLAGIPLDQNSSKALSYALAYNTSLRTIYLDSCSTGYASQRHIVAGIVSNQKATLRLITGFDLGPIAMTLGMPRLPENWSNGQVLGFIRYMWQQWLLKSGRGRTDTGEDSVKGPAPPSAVATAAKIAFSSLGAARSNLFQTEEHEKRPAEQPPVDESSVALMERTKSGTMFVPDFKSSEDADVNEWTSTRERHSGETAAYPSSPSSVRSAFDDPERRSRNLQWLRLHFRSLGDIGRLPFNNADLWQLHQYYFSPPYPGADEPGSDDTMDDDEEIDGRNIEPVKGKVPPPSPAVEETKDVAAVARTVSFQTLGDAFAASSVIVDTSSCTNKRHPDEEDAKPAAKRAKSLKTRIGYYPRIMDKIQGLGSRPMEDTLSLLRQLKYTESIMFVDRNPYEEHPKWESDQPTHSDVEMVLLDLL